MPEEFKYPYLPGLLLGADPVNAGAQTAENVEVPKLGELNKRPGFRRVNHRRYNGAIVCIPDLQRICDYRKLLVMSGYPEIPGTPAPIFEHEDPDVDGGTGSPEPFWDENYPPIAVASASPTSGIDPLAVQFSSAGSYDPDGVIVDYQWTFGDGGSSTEENPQYTYAAAGNYTATLTVTDNGGKTDSTTVPIQVTASDPWVLDIALGPAVTPRSWILFGGKIYLIDDGATGGNQMLRRDGDGSWPVDIPGGIYTLSFTQMSMMEWGGNLYVGAIRWTGGAGTQNSYVLRKNGAAWVVDGQNLNGAPIGVAMYLNTYGANAIMTFINVLQDARYHTRVGAMNWPQDNFQSPINLYNSTNWFVWFDDAWVTTNGYLRGSPSAWTAAPGVAGLQRQTTVFSGEVWACSPANGLAHKATRGGAWATINLPDSWQPHTCLEANGTLWIYAEKGANSCIFSYDGAVFTQEHEVPTVDFNVEFLMEDGVNLYAVCDDNDIFRRAL